ncbi:DUF7133 domain-containing protein [Verrucomicrobium spinosum]|uniref:DUF7133 domain-containing protein n=1 Tax=Verrucomicrobium spinosum TaxID=2736 RepID=UPI0009467196
MTCDFRGNRVNRFHLTESGSSYISKQLPDVLASTHRGFRPIDVRTGPDGALYIADWFNPIIQHGEVDFRDPRRDRVNGRIWKLTAKDRKLSSSPDFSKAEIPALLEELKSPRRWNRLFAKRELRTREPQLALASIDEWALALKKEDPNYWNNLLEAAWARETLNACSPASFGSSSAPRTIASARVPLASCAIASRSSRMRTPSWPPPSPMTTPRSVSGPWPSPGTCSSPRPWKWRSGRWTSRWMKASISSSNSQHVNRQTSGCPCSSMAASSSTPIPSTWCTP